MSAYESNTIPLDRQERPVCALVQDVLPLYLEGEVSPRTRTTITEHLARCEECAGFLAGAQSARAQLRREQAQRVSAVHRDRPAQQVAASGQQFVSLITFILGALALAAIVSITVIAVLRLVTEPYLIWTLVGYGVAYWQRLLWTVVIVGVVAMVLLVRRSVTRRD